MLWTKLLIGLFAASGAAQSTDGLYDLVKRRLPNHVDNFRFSLVSNITGSNGGYDQFIVQDAPNGTVMVQGTSLSALSSGYVVKVYLKTQHLLTTLVSIATWPISLMWTFTGSLEAGWIRHLLSFLVSDPQSMARALFPGDTTLTLVTYSTSPSTTIDD